LEAFPRMLTYSLARRIRPRLLRAFAPAEASQASASLPAGPAAQAGLGRPGEAGAAGDEAGALRRLGWALRLTEAAFEKKLSEGGSGGPDWQI
jgi:hypothetical protein